jgi:hypothetical protein
MAWFRAGDRLLSGLLSWRLDGELAGGSPPEWSRLHAARADHLVSSPFRTELADNWDRLVGIAAGSVPGTASARRLLRKETVVETTPQIRELTALLRAPRPVAARGVASAYRLLTDGTGPLYNADSGTILSDAVANAIVLLDPAHGSLR